MDKSHTITCWHIVIDVERTTGKFAVLPSKFEFHICADDHVRAIHYAQRKLINEGWTINCTRWDKYELIDIRR